MLLTSPADLCRQVAEKVFNLKVNLHDAPCWFDNYEGSGIHIQLKDLPWVDPEDAFHWPIYLFDPEGTIGEPVPNYLAEDSEKLEQKVIDMGLSWYLDYSHHLTGSWVVSITGPASKNKGNIAVHKNRKVAMALSAVVAIGDAEIVLADSFDTKLLDKPYGR